MAATKEMREVWCYRPFKEKCGGLVIDEAHAIVEMGTDAFRKAYQELGVFRHLVCTVYRHWLINRFLLFPSWQCLQRYPPLMLLQSSQVCRCEAPSRLDHPAKRAVTGLT